MLTYSSLDNHFYFTFVESSYGTWIYWPFKACVVLSVARLVLICCHAASIVSGLSPSKPPHLPSCPRLIPLSVGRQVTVPVWLRASVEALVKSGCQVWIMLRC